MINALFFSGLRTSGKKRVPTEMSSTLWTIKCLSSTLRIGISA
jgi:hypothetical protein